MNRQMLHVLLAIAAIALGGCGTSGRPQTFDVAVSTDPSLGPTSVAVDLVAANPSLADTLAEIAVSDYFTPGNRVRAGVDRKTFRFVDGEQATQTLARNDPIWGTWMDKGATQLFVIANLLGGFEDRPGAADDRRLVLPLARDRWDSRSIRITVKEGYLELSSPMRPGDN